VFVEWLRDQASEQGGEGEAADELIIVIVGAVAR
jgi:hypothetical protein